MAGAGYKAFADGDVLTAAQVQTYLQDQAVMRFADSSARTTALGTAVAEGMVSYLQDTDTVEVYDGSAWTEVGPEPKITQVENVYVDTNQTVSSGTWVDLTGVTLTLTPTSDTHKFLITYSGLLVPNNVTPCEFRLDRGGTALGDSFFYEAGASKDSLQSYTYLDSPGTASAVTYKVEAQMPSGGSTVFASSSLTVMEVSP